MTKEPTMTDDTARADLIARVCAEPGCGLPKELHGAPPGEPPNPTRSSHRFHARPSGLLREALEQAEDRAKNHDDLATAYNIMADAIRAALAADEPGLDVEHCAGCEGWTSSGRKCEGLAARLREDAKESSHDR